MQLLRVALASRRAVARTDEVNGETNKGLAGEQSFKRRGNKARHDGLEEGERESAKCMRHGFGADACIYGPLRWRRQAYSERSELQGARVKYASSGISSFPATAVSAHRARVCVQSAKVDLA